MVAGLLITSVATVLLTSIVCVILPNNSLLNQETKEANNKPVDSDVTVNADCGKSAALFSNKLSECS